MNEGWHPEERLHHKAELKYSSYNLIASCISVIFTFIAVITAIYTVVLSQGTLEAANKTLQLEERPWIGAPEIEVESMAENSRYYFDLTFSNIGKTSTNGLFVDANVVRDFDIEAEWDRMCSDGRDAVTTSKDTNRFSIIPNAKFHIPPNGFPSNKRNDLSRLLAESLKSIHEPHIVGCVVYRSWIDNTPHQTAFAAPLQRLEDGKIRIRHIYSNYAN